jgi:peroxiredoxin
MIKVHDVAPDFRLHSDNIGDYQLSDHRGERVLLVFYPGDNTPVCTRQLCEYRDAIGSFKDLGVSVVGISSNSLESHRGFRARHKFPFVLLSDPDLDVAKRYGCTGFLGMKRAIFLIDESGTVRYVHIEVLSLFRRKSNELLKVISALDIEVV